ncbi:TPA: hypothetical protein QDA83_001631 [Burkholderia multivorans]|uniref:hypothetical protein n=1 Tax=Burkholderia multivorans TaxID=87883 RepID=UPI001590F927|nr:hypothetical protein [Burkholderia multivorans]MBU9301840.1 hypothetical protein [Burkholderia multivorans]MBU9505488.1 hypothetical protein [Burkholderia multivorans]MCA8458272.1 hypothetical protein [Burkholderia multivorans]MDN8001176.1 hypothetical protein [Burkholderia multivorans]MDN8015776.1 hypothetical protein [Burkholderia multivorans]
MPKKDLITPPHRLIVGLRDLPSGAPNIAALCGGPMKYGFLFSIKRNESQRYGVAARPRAAPPGFLSGWHASIGV